MTVGRSDWAGGEVQKSSWGGAVLPALVGGTKSLGLGGGVREEFKRKFFLAAFDGQKFTFLRLKVKKLAWGD